MSVDQQIAEQLKRITQQDELLKATEADRDRWKQLAQTSERKLVSLRESLRESLEGSE